MGSEREFRPPEFDESSIAAVHLLQGVVYDDERTLWELLLRHQSRLSSYFIRIGLRLVIDEFEGFAFVRQLVETELEQVPGYDQLPKLFHRKRLSYDATLACVLLRETLRRFEEEQADDSRCVVSTDELFAEFRTFVPASQDDVKARKALAAALGILEELKFIRLFTKEPQEWEIRRILKARLPLAELETLRAELEQAAVLRMQANPGDES
jgi:hypothetical protein